MKKNQPQKRLGRGLDNLISGGLQKPQPPSIQIDRVRVGASDEARASATPPPTAAEQKDLVKDLNALIKKTQNNIDGKFTAGDKLDAADKFNTDGSSSDAADARELTDAELIAKADAYLKENDTSDGEEALPTDLQKSAGAAPASKNSQKNTARPPQGNLPQANAAQPVKPQFPHVTKASVSGNIGSLKNNAQPNNVSPAQGVFMLLPTSVIKISPFQRRKEFSSESLKELADSIRSEGLMQPVVVRALPEGGYELIAGERRLRACQSIGMEVLPARVVSVQDASAAVMGLIENLQRVNLNPVEEARGYGMLLTDFHMTQDQIAERVGKPRPTVANSLRLMLLEPEVLGYVAKGQLSVGHAKVLLSLQEGSNRVMLARMVVEQALSVRQTEALTRKALNMGDAAGSKVPTKRMASAEEMAVVTDLQKRVVARLNAKVNLNHSAKGGRMVIYYKSNAELEDILKKMGV